jgi:hypothetical protein
MGVPLGCRSTSINCERPLRQSIASLPDNVSRGSWSVRPSSSGVIASWPPWTGSPLPPAPRLLDANDDHTGCCSARWESCVLLSRRLSSQAPRSSGIALILSPVDP